MTGLANGCRVPSGRLPREPSRRLGTSLAPHTRATPTQWRSWLGRSALGPYLIGHVGIPTGTSGHDQYEETAGHRTFTPSTSAGEVPPKRIRTPRSALGPQWREKRRVTADSGGRLGLAMHRRPGSVGGRGGRPAPAVGLGPKLALKLHEAPDPGAVGPDVGFDLDGHLADGGQVDAEQLPWPRHSAGLTGW
jgi:hypothetical protein